MKSKILSIYLPQFHTIPENDNWWGKGFTEWTNVKRGRKYYPWQYQPREPLYDDYYDLSDLRVLEEHTRLARKAGIYGFCFYQYYSCGRKLLEKPVEKYRDNSDEKFPYCLIWANESWERTWYRANNNKEVLFKQIYGEEKDWREHFNYLLDFFKDERYIKVDNKPIYIIYIPQRIKKRKEMFALWNKLAKKNGFDGLYLIAMNTGYGVDYKEHLYDGIMNFEPLRSIREDNSLRSTLVIHRKKYLKNKKLEKSSLWNYFRLNTVYSYNYICKQIEASKKNKKCKTFLGITTGWDNTARKDEDGMIITGSTPKKFGKNVKKVLEKSEEWDSPFVFLNSWNEWSEGTYIQPDKRYGYAYLNELKKAIKQQSSI